MADLLRQPQRLERQFMVVVRHTLKDDVTLQHHCRCLQPSNRRAFTLVELLTVIVIIAIILALSLATLGRTRQASRAAKCATNLGQIAVLQSIFAESHNKGRYANAFEPRTPFAQWLLGNTLYIYDETLSQTRFWLGPLVAAGFMERFPPEHVLSCPSVLAMDGSPYLHLNPHAPSMFSYWYSPAFFTSSELWDPAQPQNRQSPDNYRRSIPTHDVTFPSRKVVYFESGDHHRSGKFIGLQPLVNARLNVAAADGHVTTRDPNAGLAALEARWPTEDFPTRLGTLVPFSSPPHGHRGTDW
jgi:prepilin-type N-terminal cleavage/methylation domain-containing protein